MALKQWFLLLLPLIIILFVFVLFMPITKDPLVVLSAAENKKKSLDSFYLEANIVMDLGIMNTVMRYVSNSTVFFLNNESHVHTLIMQPFSSDLIVNDQFIIDEGNYSCVSNLLRPVCYIDSNLVEYGGEDFNQSSYKSIEYLGIKKVINRPCDAILTRRDISVFQGLVSDFEVGNFSKINNITFYSCIDVETGIVLESLWTIIGESNYGGYLVETSINISKTISDFSLNITNEDFTLPYEVVSEEDYLLLINQTYEELSQGL